MANILGTGNGGWAGRATGDFGEATIETMVDGANVLAAIWTGA